MTILVGIRCTDGIVIGADSSATFVGVQNSTIEQPTNKKISVIYDQFIVAGTGAVGHHQRFSALVTELYDKKTFSGKSDLEIAKILSSELIKELSSTHSPADQYSALVAYPAKHQPVLIELAGGRSQFQPELKELDGLWFASMGSGQQIADPFLALFRQVFWSGGPPDVTGGIFTALWALKHACDVNPGGIKEPIHIAVLRQVDGELAAKKLNDQELAEHTNMVEEATRHFAAFKDVLNGKNSPAIPKP
jgi:ATP-dependent protease HslVU (ClpYQ) peptidase subunit